MRVKILIVIALLTMLMSPAALLAQGNTVEFSGLVKKVRIKKNKVAIKDPETKKRFTLILTDQSKLKGYSTIRDIKKGDSVKGKYNVTSGGKYIASELGKN